MASESGSGRLAILGLEELFWALIHSSFHRRSLRGHNNTGNTSGFILHSVEFDI